LVNSVYKQLAEGVKWLRFCRRSQLSRCFQDARVIQPA